MMTSFLWWNKSSCALVLPNYSKSEVETFIVKLVQFAESFLHGSENATLQLFHNVL